jgi:dipeptidyl aminopeptidase/acylaminoacyl peptidase
MRMIKSVSRTRLVAAVVAVASAIGAEGQTPAPAAAPAPKDTTSAVITPAPNLHADGMPALPASITDAVGRYTEFRTASFAGWHPTRREALILTRFADTNQVHEVRLPGGMRRQLTFFKDRVAGASWPRHAGDYYVFARDTGGDEFRQIYRTDVATGETTLVSDGGRSQNDLGPWSHDGDRMAYGSTRRNGADRDIYIVNPKDPATDRRLLTLNGGGWSVADWSPDDAKLAVREYVSINETYLWVADVATGEKTRVTPKVEGELVSYRGAQWSADGKGLWVTTDRESEFQRLAYLDLASGKHRYYTTDIRWDVALFDVSPDGRTIAVVTNEDGIGRLRFVDAASGEARLVTALPVGVIGSLDWHENGKEVGLSLSSARSPSDMYSVNAATGQVERWTESETGGLNAANFIEPELVRWQSFDRRTISGFLYKPAARFTGRRPVMINIHGGPESQFQPGFLGRSNFYLDELGVAILFPNVRGSSGYGKSYLLLDNARKREDSVKDIGALIDWIATRPELDASRIMVTGGSYGGYMTLASATHFDDKLRASLAVVGISSFVTFLENTEDYRRDLRRAEYGDERDPAMREFLLSISPLTNASKITKPLFVVQGKNDPRVPYTESEQMVATIRKNQGPVWYLLADDEGHGFAKKSNQDFQFYATVEFIRRYLLAPGDGQPAG